MADFETAEHNAALGVWPEACIRGCLFHFLQACHRHFIALFGNKYVSAWSKVVTKLQALAACRHPVLFSQQLQEFDTYLNNNTMQSFARYFQAQWVDRVAPATWSCFQEVDDIVIRHRTNNVLEGHSFNQ